MTIAASTIRTLFANSVFAHANMTAITTNAFNYNILALTEKNISALKYNQQINFFTYLVLRSINYDITSLGTGTYGYQYEVLITYYREVDILNNAHNIVVDAMETLDNTINSELGVRWSATVDTSKQSNTNLPSITTIENYNCWTSSVLWTGLEHN